MGIFARSDWRLMVREGEGAAAVLLRHLQEAFRLANQTSRFPGFKWTVCLFVCLLFFLATVVVVPRQRSVRPKLARWAPSVAVEV